MTRPLPCAPTASEAPGQLYTARGRKEAAGPPANRPTSTALAPDGGAPTSSSSPAHSPLLPLPRLLHTTPWTPAQPAPPATLHGTAGCPLGPPLLPHGPPSHTLAPPGLRMCSFTFLECSQPSCADPHASRGSLCRVSTLPQGLPSPPALSSRGRLLLPCTQHLPGASKAP